MGEWLTFTFALTGRRNGEHGTRGVAPGYELTGLSARAGPQPRFFPHNLHQFNISILNTLPLGLNAYRNVFREIDMSGEESASKEEL